MSVLLLVVILVVGIIISYIFNLIKVPKLIGYIVFGIILGYLSIFNAEMSTIGGYLRKIALVIILTRAGLSLDISKLRKLGKTAILICFIPAIFEIVATVIFGPLILPIDHLEALLLGSVLAAVSPAIIVPRMIKYKDKYNSNMPELLLAGSSVDDIFVITVFYSVLGMFSDSSITTQLIQLPIGIILGVGVGIVFGFLLRTIFTKLNVNKYVIVIVTLLISLCLVLLETLVVDYIQFQSLISIIIIGLFLTKINKIEEVKTNYNKLWFIFEIFLFVFVGGIVDLELAFNYGFEALLLLTITLSFRSLGVLICLIGTNINIKEKIFCVIGYLPKATVQASIGAVALSQGLEVGNLILSLAVLTILITAPLGAMLLDSTTPKLLCGDRDIK
ncbi:MAG: cation:proton antiporter [bacterium]